MVKSYFPLFILNSIEDTTDASQNSGWPETNSFQTMGQLFLLIIIFIGVLVLAFYSTKLIGSAKNLKKGGNIRIIESVGVGYNGAVQIIKVGESYYLLGVTKEKITFLKELDKDSIDLSKEKSFETGVPFEKHLKKLFDRKDDTNTNENKED